MNRLSLTFVIHQQCMTDFWIVGGSSYDNLAATLVVKYFDKQQFTKRNHDKKHFVRNWKIMLSFDQGNIVLNCKTSLCTVNKKKFLWTQKKSWKLVSKRNLSRAREHFSKNAKETENTKMNCFKNIPFFEYPHFPRMAPIRFRCSRNFFFLADLILVAWCGHLSDIQLTAS